MNTKMNVVYKLIGIITSTIKRILQTLKPKHYMSNDLKTRIKQFNEIKYPNDNSKRIIVATLKAKTVTQGSKDKE
jgi:hypothetical protein